jgi:hypothetical protein
MGMFATAPRPVPATETGSRGLRVMARCPANWISELQLVSFSWSCPSLAILSKIRSYENTCNRKSFGI